MEFEAEVNEFLAGAQRHGLRVIMVGGAAVNHHGYKRHSADVDLWIEPEPANFERLLAILRGMGYAADELPEKVLRAEQNISIKISPGQEIELITRFDPGCTFDEHGCVASSVRPGVSLWPGIGYSASTTSSTAGCGAPVRRTCLMSMSCSAGRMG